MPVSRNGHGQEKSEDRERLSLARPSADGFLTGRPLVKEEDDSCDKWTITADRCSFFRNSRDAMPVRVPSNTLATPGFPFPPRKSTLQHLSTCYHGRNNDLGFPNRNPSNWKYICLGRIDSPAGLKQCCYWSSEEVIKMERRDIRQRWKKYYNRHAMESVCETSTCIFNDQGPTMENETAINREKVVGGGERQ